MILKNSKDLPLVALAVVQISLWILTLSFFNSLSILTLVALALLQAFLISTNFQVIAHNFIHHRFFQAKVLNSLFSVINSANLGAPSSLYFAHHMNHHRYNNGPGDRSSTWAHGQPGSEESLWRYSLLSPLRTPMTVLYREARKTHPAFPIYVEVGFLLSALTGLALWSPWASVYALAVVYVGQVLAAAENHLEHFGGRPGDARRGAVSCYSHWYNRIWFNNGYHQEHHFRPGLHWSDVPVLRPQLPHESERRVVSGAHWMFWRQPLNDLAATYCEEMGSPSTATPRLTSPLAASSKAWVRGTNSK